MAAMEALRNKVAELLVSGVEQDYDGAILSRQLDSLMDSKFGPGTSERIQRGPCTNILLEMVCGLWEEEPQALIKYMEEWVNKKKKGD